MNEVMLNGKVLSLDSLSTEELYNQLDEIRDNERLIKEEINEMLNNFI